MRIWSIHPSLLDSKGLVACWRETLLAQKVLQGLTRGYTNHPQLHRFRTTSNPLEAIASYLHGLCDEADSRDYHFDRSKIAGIAQLEKPLIPVTVGQAEYELAFLMQKVEKRDEKWFAEHLHGLEKPAIHPLFFIVPGGIEPWEKVKDI